MAALSEPLTFERVRPLDWQRIVTELRRRGFTFRSLVKIVGVSRQTLWRYQLGTEPDHVEGERILALWCEVNGRVREEAPIRGVR